MITPFGEDDRIDFAALANEARFLLSCGVSGIVVGGSMGEGAGMSEDELAEAVRTTIAAVQDSIPVLSGIIADSSSEAVRLAKAARAAGASGLQVPPPHFCFTMDTGVLGQYYRAITEGSGLPLIIYNVVPWAQAAVESLQEITSANPDILGVKQSGRNIHMLVALLATMKGKIKIYSAIDDMIYPSFMLGVDGTISGTSCVFPRETVAIMKAVRAGDHATAKALHERLAPVWRAIDLPEFPGLAKYAIRLGGRPAGWPRRPFTFPAGNLARKLENTMREMGFLAVPSPINVEA
jgi:4-hydroxy-tetrahydrodipicolinate synthase